MASSPPPPSGPPPETPPQPPPPLKPPPLVNLTPWARKYGITPTRVRFNAMYNPAYPTIQKSFYTPVPPIHPNILPRDSERLNNFIKFQVLRLKGFTTLALIENDLISERPLGGPGLTNPIHPLLSRHRWEVHLPGMLTYPLIDGNGADRGIWDPKNNDLAWKVLLPSLRLASMILAHLHTHPWLDTLLLGKEEPLDPNRFPPPSLNQVHPSTPQMHNVIRIRQPSPSQAQECAAAFEELQLWPALQNLQIGIVNNYKGHLGQTHYNDNMVNGYASWLSDQNGNRCAIYLAYERFELLLKPHLSDSDRLCLQLLIANTMIHEIMHVIGTAKRHRDQVLAGGSHHHPIQFEPFVEDEVVAELGCSIDNAVWGGTLMGIQDTADPFMVPMGSGVIKGPQPALSAYPALLTPPLPKTDLFRPIQVDYYVGIQENDFWDFNVRNFSHFRPGQILRNAGLVNLVSIRDRQPPSAWQVAEDMQEYLKAAAPANSAAAIFNKLLLMTPADRIAFANARRRKQIHEKYVNLMELRIRQTETIWDQVEMMARGDLERNGYSLVQCLSSLLASIGDVLGTLADLLTALGDFDTSSAAYISGIADAQSFNRGVRRLLGDIALTSDLPELRAQAADLYRTVENTRMLLAACSESPTGISLENDMALAEHDEADCVQRIEDAKGHLERGDHDTANTMCEQVSRSMSSTLLTKCAARILMCNSDKNEHIIRMNVVSRTIKTLQKAPPPAGRAVEQARVLDFALQLQRVLLQTQPPNSTGVFIA